MTNPPESGQQPEKLILPGEAPTGKLRKPWSSGMRMTVIAGGFVGMAFLWSIVSGSGSHSSTGETVDPGANTVIEKTLVGEPSDAIKPPFDTVDHSGVMVETGFGADWTATASGRQVLFANSANTIACQSLVMPLTEYHEYVGQFSGGFPEYSQAGTLEGIRQAGEQTGRPISTSIISTKPIPTNKLNWTGLSYIVETSLGANSIRRLHYAISSSDAKNAATLNCAVTDPNSTESTALDTIVRAYKLAPVKKS